MNSRVLLPWSSRGRDYKNCHTPTQLVFLLSGYCITLGRCVPWHTCGSWFSLSCGAAGNASWHTCGSWFSLSCGAPGTHGTRVGAGSLCHVEPQGTHGIARSCGCRYPLSHLTSHHPSLSLSKRGKPKAKFSVTTLPSRERNS